MDRDSKVWLYCRLVQHDETAMLRQEKILRDSVEDGYVIVGVTHEYGPGLKIDRPGLREIQAKTREGIIGQIRVIRTDRICRNALLAEQWIQDTIQYGVSIAMLGDGRLTHFRLPKFEYVACYIRFGSEMHAGAV
ncbi:MAG: recombinase family protein [Ethanoligenens sp.]